MMTGNRSVGKTPTVQALRTEFKSQHPCTTLGWGREVLGAYSPSAKSQTEVALGLTDQQSSLSRGSWVSETLHLSKDKLEGS